MRRAVLAALLALLPAAGVTGCGTAPGTGAVAPANESRSLSPFDIQQGLDRNVASLYDLIAERRPRWLQASGASRRTAVRATVWLDNMRLGGITELHSIALATVLSVQYLTASEAQMTLGLDNPGGAIVVTTR